MHSLYQTWHTTNITNELLTGYIHINSRVDGRLHAPLMPKSNRSTESLNVQPRDPGLVEYWHKICNFKISILAILV
jgi:hypothetical protein